MTDIDDDLDLIATAIADKLRPSLTAQLQRHQMRMARIWITPPEAARLARVANGVVYAALHDGSLPGSFNAAANGGRGAWFIRREDFERWVATVRRPAR